MTRFHAGQKVEVTAGYFLGKPHWNEATILKKVPGSPETWEVVFPNNNRNTFVEEQIRISIQNDTSNYHTKLSSGHAQELNVTSINTELIQARIELREAREREIDAFKILQEAMEISTAAYERETNALHALFASSRANSNV